MRLQRLTTRADGVTVPKQFCSLRSGRSLLQDTVARALQLTPRARVVVVVVDAQAPWWRPQLADLPPENVLVQPGNRGTAIAVLFAVGAILARDPRARIAVLPSDHFLAQPGPLLATLQRALHRTALDRQCLHLLGIEPDSPDTEYGWVVPGADLGRGVVRVERFVEKPAAPVAAALMAAGALWHSFVLASAARAVWALGESVCSAATAALAAALATPSATRAQALAELWPSLPDLDFARHLLPGHEERLRMLRVPACGWTDLGTPARLGACVAQLLRQPGAQLTVRDPAIVDLVQAAREQHLVMA